MTTLLEQHLGLILDKQATFAAHIDLDADWSADLEHGELDIGDASLTVRGIGSYARQNQSWLWLWANHNITLPADAAHSAKTLRDYARRQTPARENHDDRTLFQNPADTALLNTAQFLLNEAELPNLGIITCALTGADATTTATTTAASPSSPSTNPNWPASGNKKTACRAPSPPSPKSPHPP